MRERELAGWSGKLAQMVFNKTAAESLRNDCHDMQLVVQSNGSSEPSLVIDTLEIDECYCSKTGDAPSSPTHEQEQDLEELRRLKQQLDEVQKRSDEEKALPLESPDSADDTSSVDPEVAFSRTLCCTSLPATAPPEPYLQANKTCASGHQLRAANAIDDSCFCSVCDATVRKGTILHGCRLCDYDECDSCLHKVQMPSLQIQEPGSSLARRAARAPGSETDPRPRDGSPVYAALPRLLPGRGRRWSYLLRDGERQASSDDPDLSVNSLVAQIASLLDPQLDVDIDLVRRTLERCGGDRDAALQAVIDSLVPS